MRRSPEEKAGIVKPGAILVLGETDPDLVEIFQGAGPEATVLRDRDFWVGANRLAVGGRVVELVSQYGPQRDVFLPLHGAHQADNAAIALAAAEAFLGRALDADVVTEAFASVTSPGRLEVVGHEPLVVIDGTKNVAGAHAVRAALDEEFPAPGDLVTRTWVVGILQQKDAFEMLDALGVRAGDRVVACRAPRSRAARDPQEIADAARELGVDPEHIDMVESVAAAVRRAIDASGPDGSGRGGGFALRRRSGAGRSSGRWCAARPVGSASMSNQTLVLCKPDAVERRLVGEIVGRLERKGLTIVAMEQRTIDAELAGRHYEEHREKPFFGDLVAFITRGPLVAMVVEGGDDTWKVVRGLMGTTNPREAAPGTIRGDLALETQENLVHGSDGTESAAREIALFFPNLA